jgi:uncharacterized protein YndB with AHSA1/START domain
MRCGDKGGAAKEKTMAGMSGKAGGAPELELAFTVAARIARPVAEVFEAVADPAQLSHFFTTGGAKGRLVTGATVTWDFHDFPGAFPVEVVEVTAPERIVLRWAANEPGAAQEGGRPAAYKTTVTMSFEPLDGGRRTLVTIAEEGWRPTPGGLRGSYGNCQGWTNMLDCMKAWLEHGVVLREGLFK